MILVVLGTQDKPFTRLLEAMEVQINEGKIKDQVIVQKGLTSFTSKRMTMFDLIAMDEFDALLNQADIVITHSGVGSILGALTKQKKVIACAREAKYGEHTNDHQLEILGQFAKMGYVLPCTDFSELAKMLENINDFTPNPYKSTTKCVVDEIKSFIDSY